MCIDLDNVSKVGRTQRVITEELRRQLTELEAERTRRRQLDEAQKLDLVQREADTGRELNQVDQQIAVAAEYVETLRTGFGRYKEFLRRELVVQMQVDAKEQALMSERQRLETLKRERLQLETRRSELRSQIAIADTKSASTQSDLARQIAQINQAIAEGESRRAVSLTAPRDGIVTGVIAQPGELIAAGTPMVTILPTNVKLQAQFGARSSAIGFVRPGQSVMLRYEAFPYQKFGQYPGHVKTVSRAALRPGEFTDIRRGAEGVAGAQNLYLVVVEPERDEVDAYGAAKKKLTPGMQVQATVFLDRRPLYQWILDPLYSLRGVADGGPRSPSVGRQVSGASSVFSNTFVSASPDVFR